VLLLATPGVAFAAIVALLVLVCCAVSVAVGRWRSRNGVAEVRRARIRMARRRRSGGAEETPGSARGAWHGQSADAPGGYGRTASTSVVNSFWPLTFGW
jgi:hypothetical protein